MWHQVGATRIDEISSGHRASETVVIITLTLGNEVGYKVFIEHEPRRRLAPVFMWCTICTGFWKAQQSRGRGRIDIAPESRYPSQITDDLAVIP